VFGLHPNLLEVKQKLLQQGAVYVAMSGSGSTLYGIFEAEPTTTIYQSAPNYFEKIVKCEF
jgi:4-diphosphocytidyl-2-C-methyl-D-erythritol kinase